MKLILTTAIILLSAISAFTQVYYVAPGGAALLSMNSNTLGSLSFAIANALAQATPYG
ncbi:MAG: hypothetical protein IPH78_14900 [Bacteroidetes bacterium]|nr:hypothetical protein [Bacteroidota bacterium]